MQKPNAVKALERAIEILDGQRALARELSKVTEKRVTQGNIWSWLNRTQETPPEFAPFIEALTRIRNPTKPVTREDLCPDFPWGEVHIPGSTDTTKAKHTTTRSRATA